MLILYLIIFAIGFAILSAGFFIFSLNSWLMFAALILTIAGAIFTTLKLSGSKVSDESCFDAKSSSNPVRNVGLATIPAQLSEAEKLLRLSYLIHLTVPTSPLPAKAGFALNCFCELSASKTCIIYRFDHGAIEFVAGRIFEAGKAPEILSIANPLTEEVTEKLNNVIDFKRINKSRFFIDRLPLKRNEANNQLTIAPITFFGTLQGILAIIENNSSAKLQNNSMIEIFSRNLAVMFQNHNLFVAARNDMADKAETELCKSLLSTALPVEKPRVSGWESAFFNRLAANYTGDFYDFIDISDRKKLVIIGTTSGNGLNAALYFTKLKSMIRCLCENISGPAQLLNSLSRILCSDKNQELFSTMMVIEIKKGESELRTAVAGHALPLINRVRSGYVQIADLQAGVPLGLFSEGNEPYTDQLIQLLPGDGVFLYTDGVTEIVESNNERLASETMKIILEKLPELSAEETLAAIQNELFNNLMSKQASPVIDLTGVYLKLE